MSTFGPKFLSDRICPKVDCFLFQECRHSKNTSKRKCILKYKQPNGPKVSPNCANELSSKGPTDQGTSRLSTERSASVEFTTLRLTTMTHGDVAGLVRIKNKPTRGCVRLSVNRKPKLNLLKSVN